MQPKGGAVGQMMTKIDVVGYETVVGKEQTGA